MILNMSGGGGGASLNFKVVGGTSKPSNPSVNTIWVNTSTAITSWVFSATEPEAPAAGMVWISTGTSSTVEFNALKKNGIMVYPLSAKQYANGAWVNVTAKSYQNGAWVDWIPENYFFYKGNTCDHITGGYKLTDATLEEDHIYMSVGANTWTLGCTNEKVDLTNLATLYFEFEDFTTNTADVWAKAVVSSVQETNLDSTAGSVARVQYAPGSAVSGVPFTIEINVSSITGEYYLNFGANRGSKSSYTGSFKLVNIRGEA